MDKDGLCKLVQGRLQDYPCIVASNREPYVHVYSGRKIKVEVPASGLTVALDPMMQTCGGIWIAHGSGDADRATVDENNKVRVPPHNPSYFLRRVWLSRKDEEGYYYGFSNQTLWPLCHTVYVKPKFDESHWKAYKKVNQLFAQTIIDEVGDRKAFVFIQDYHLALVSRMIKEKSKNIITAQFWHIPWPHQEAFRICPWKEELLDGLLGNDILGFHIQYHRDNFLDTVNRTIEALIDWERHEVTYGGKKTAVRPYPISIDFEAISRQSQSKEVETEIKRLRNELGLNKELIGVGFDRLDYTKGIPERLKALDRFFDKYPQYVGRVVLIQAGVPSRVLIPEYRKLMEEIETLVAEINAKFGKKRWKPIIYLPEHLSPVSLMALRRMADFFVVSSLHDGMNLVAKEFVASRFDEGGVLILSSFTGAARELTDALLINPYATDYFAEAIKTALEMPEAERTKRMKKMRDIVRENNVYKWASDIIQDLLKFEFGE